MPWGESLVQFVLECRGAASSRASGGPTTALLQSLAVMAAATISLSAVTTCRGLEE